MDALDGLDLPEVAPRDAWRRARGRIGVHGIVEHTVEVRIGRA